MTATIHHNHHNHIHIHIHIHNIHHNHHNHHIHHNHHNHHNLRPRESSMRHLLLGSSLLILASACTIATPRVRLAQPRIRVRARVAPPPPVYVETHVSDTRRHRRRRVEVEPPPAPPEAYEPEAYEEDETEPEPPPVAKKRREPTSKVRRGPEGRCPEFGRDAGPKLENATEIGFGIFDGCFSLRDEIDGFVVDVKEGEPVSFAIKNLSDDSGIFVDLYDVSSGSGAHTTFRVSSFQTGARTFRPKKDTRYFIRLKSYTASVVKYRVGIIRADKKVAER